MLHMSTRDIDCDADNRSVYLIRETYADTLRAVHSRNYRVENLICAIFSAFR